MLAKTSTLIPIITEHTLIQLKLVVMSNMHNIPYVGVAAVMYATVHYGVVHLTALLLLV
jgi:hypothetical protein